MAWRDPWDDVGRDNALRAQQTQGQVGTLAALSNMQNNALVQRRAEEKHQLDLRQQTQLREILSNPNVPAEVRDRALLSMGQPGLQALGALSTIDDRNERAALRRAQEAEARRKSAEAERQSGAVTQLLDLLTPKPLPSGNMPQMAMSEEQAIRMAQEAQARGEPARVVIPDMAKVRGLAAIVDPKAAVTELMKAGMPPKPQTLGDMVRATAGGYVEQGPDGRIQFTRTESDRPPPQERGPSITQLADPNDPSKTLVIDARLYRGGSVGSPGVVGVGPKLTQAGTIDAKTAKQTEGLASDIQQAEDLLMGVKRTSDGQVVSAQKPTGSGAGQLLDAAGRVVGITVPGSSEAGELKLIAGRLISRVPRFEGPQSDRDVALYKEMAADVGNENKTTTQRLAALRRMRELYDGYESGRRGRLIQPRGGATDTFSSPQPPAAPALPPGFRVMP